MITVVNFNEVAPGKLSEAVDFSKRAASHRKNVYSQDSKVMRPTTGKQSMLVWVNTFDSYAKREEILEKEKENSEWKALMKELHDNEYFMPNAMVSYIYEILE